MTRSVSDNMPDTMPDTMKVIIASPIGGPETLQLATRPLPQMKSEEVLIKVSAAGVNGADMKERQGKYPVPQGAPDIMGLEVSGEIVAVGRGCRRFAAGDHVCALLIGGGYAEYAVAPEGQCMAVPKNVSLVESAGIPEIFCTVWANMIDRCALQAGETVLIQGGTSGIGYAGIKLAKAFQATVFATARTEKKCAAMRRFGADHVINYREQVFHDVCRTETDGRGIDVIVDIVGGDYLPKEVALLAHGGRLVIINLPAGKIAEVDFGHVHARHLTITGSRMRPRSIADKSKICRALEQHVWPLFETGEICTETFAVFPFSQAADAHRLMESSNHIGKIILTP